MISICLALNKLWQHFSQMKCLVYSVRIHKHITDHLKAFKSVYLLTFLNLFVNIYFLKPLCDWGEEKKTLISQKLNLTHPLQINQKEF